VHRSTHDLLVAAQLHGMGKQQRWPCCWLRLHSLLQLVALLGGLHRGCTTLQGQQWHQVPAAAASQIPVAAAGGTHGSCVLSTSPALMEGFRAALTHVEQRAEQRIAAARIPAACIGCCWPTAAPVIHKSPTQACG
jgi:hypothetical protein